MVGFVVAEGLAYMTDRPWPLAGFAVLFALFLVARVLRELVPGLRAWMRLRLGGVARVIEAVTAGIFHVIAFFDGSTWVQDRPAPAPPAVRPTAVRRDG